ncbi:hypothetical protein F4859DRAFT_214734 [Xylaria cf. heliscus]|nr:hypothetical protein F4859DRAFT_214734 [Xylaria cf. heliscus]
MVFLLGTTASMLLACDGGRLAWVARRCAGRHPRGSPLLSPRSCVLAEAHPRIEPLEDSRPGARNDRNTVSAI